MSWEAVNWANEQRTPSASCQLVLLLLANWADAEGVVKDVRASYIAPRARESERTVYRRLKELEDFGLLEREAAGRRANGSEKIVAKLRLDAKFDVEALAAEGGHCQSDSGGDCQIGSDPTANLTVGGGVTDTGVSGATATAVSAYKTQIDNSNIPTPTTSGEPPRARTDEPSGEPSEGADGEAESDVVPDDFAAFRKAYPFDATMGVREAREAFAELSAKDRAKATRFASLYAAELKARGRTQPKDAARWLRERRFDEVAEVAGAKAPNGKALVFVAEGTRAWDAWVASGHKRGLNNSADPERRGRTGWWFPSCFPPGAAEKGESG